jgi:hypothetical protein
MTHKFRAIVELAPNDRRGIDVECSCDGEYTYIYDDVYDALTDRFRELYPEEYYPLAQIVDIFIFETENREINHYPVIANDSEKENNIKKYEKDYKKILILECYRYCLTQEMLLYMTLVKNGIIEDTEDYGNFDFDVYHNVLEEMKAHNKRLEEVYKED